MLLILTETGPLVKRLKNYVTEHYYQCTPEILPGLGKLYAGSGDFTMNIDRPARERMAVFAGEAIAIYYGETSFLYQNSLDCLYW